VRWHYLVPGALGLWAACSSDKPSAEDRDESSVEPSAEAASAPALPPLTPLGKPAAELEAEGWTAVEIPSELAARLRDSGSVAPEPGSPALRRELRELVEPANALSFDSGDFADTVRLIERALMRMAAERRESREAEIVDSLQRAMEPRDPDLDAVSAKPEPLRPAVPAHPRADATIHLASLRNAPRYPAVGRAIRRLQGSQAQAIQVAPGIDGTEATSADGSSTTEVGFKRGNIESTTKSTTTSAQEYERRGEVGLKIDVTSTKRGKVEGAAQEQIERSGFERRLGYCPDESGIARGRHTRWTQSSTVLTVGTKTVNTAYEVRSDFALTVSVDDNARAQEVLIEGTSVVNISAGARGGGNARPTFKEIRADIRWQKSVHETGMVGTMYWRFPPANNEDRLDNVFLLDMVIAMDEADDLAKQAEKRWRNGACVEVTPHPERKALRYGGKTAFRIEVKHKQDGAGSFPYPVQIMAEKYPGFVNDILGKLDPQGALTAPATFHYTAPAKGSPEGETWRGSPTPDRAFPMSISRRGIGGRNFYIPYDTLRLGYALVFVHRVTSKLGEERNVKMKAVVRELDTPDAEGNAFAGRGSYEGSFRRYRVSCDNKMRTDYETIPLAGKAKGVATADAMGDGQTGLSFTMTPLKDEGMDLIPVVQSLMLTKGKAQDSRTFTMQSDRCRGTLTHVTEWSATQIK
jgi:hypothetical protein